MYIEFAPAILRICLCESANDQWSRERSETGGNIDKGLNHCGSSCQHRV
jgi:hypothetical protein